MFMISIDLNELRSEDVCVGGRERELLPGGTLVGNRRSPVLS